MRSLALWFFAFVLLTVQVPLASIKCVCTGETTTDYSSFSKDCPTKTLPGCEKCNLEKHDQCYKIESKEPLDVLHTKSISFVNFSLEYFNSSFELIILNFPEISLTNDDSPPKIRFPDLLSFLLRAPPIV